jgi:hypothetical protein
MNICHLYYLKKETPLVEELLSSFEEKESLDLAEIEKLDPFNVYILELASVNEEISAKIKKLFASRSHPLIYFYIPKEYNIALFQLALVLKTKGYITASHDVKTILSKIQNDFTTNEDEYFQNLLGKTVLQSKHFLLFKESTLFFASKKLLEDFELKNISEVTKKLLPKLDLQTLLASETLSKDPVQNENKQSFYTRSVNIGQNNEKVVFLDPFMQGDAPLQKEVQKASQSSDKLEFIKNRISFIELLKDKTIESKISPEGFILLTLNIENIEKLRKSMTELEIEEEMRDFLLQVDILLDSKIAFAQYDKDFYIALFEHVEFEEFKKKIHEFNTKILNYFQKQKYTPLLGTFCFEIKNQELNEILNIFEKILNRTLSQEDIEKYKLEYINNIQEDMDESEVIRSLLETAYINDENVKLLNIYKGLCINTSAKVIKYRDDSIYVKLEQLQGTVMKEEKETVLQSPLFFKDIRASVKHVSLEKNVAILDEFKFLETNANARKYSRVTFDKKTFVVLSHKNATLNGEILDISVTSIAIASKYAKVFDMINDQVVKLTFVLPNPANLDGFTKMNLQAKVVFSVCDASKNCKIVCEFIHDESAEAILMEYVYNRQKEIIIELKKLAKKKKIA